MLSAVAVVVPDIAQVVNIALLLFMFVSPIGYSSTWCRPRVRVLVYFNPMTYLIESLPLRADRRAHVAASGSTRCSSATVLLATVSGAFFRRMSPVFSDYE